MNARDADAPVASATMRTGAALRIENLAKAFVLPGGERVEALSGLDLAIEPGAFVALIGPSGCGKSTLLRLIAGLEVADRGSLLIDGAAPADTTRRHRIGVAFQDHALLPWLSVRQNVALPYRLAGIDPNWTRVDELVALVGLTAFAAARPAQLSGGMRQRVSIARALALEPNLLLLDEPFGALDLVTRRMLNLEMQRVWQSLGTTTLLITHSVDEAVQLADRVLVMTPRPGRIHADFAIDLQRPRTRETTHSSDFARSVNDVATALDDAMLGNTPSREPGHERP